MNESHRPPRDTFIPVYSLYGENLSFPDVLHCEYITDRASLHDWSIEPHRHMGLHQFFLLLGGRTRMTRDGATVHIDPPQLISVPSPTAHGFTFEKGTDGYVLTIPVSQIPEAFVPDTVLGTTMSSSFIIVPDREIIRLFSTVQREFLQGGPTRVPMLRALAMQIACCASRKLSECNAGVSGAEKVSRRMVEFEHLVKQHFRDRWSGAQYAEALKISYTHLNRSCRTATGKSALKFVESIVFREACSLLAYTRTDIAVIGYHLGFEDPSYFSRAFSRCFGIAPSEYRRRLHWGGQ